MGAVHVGAPVHHSFYWHLQVLLLSFKHLLGFSENTNILKIITMLFALYLYEVIHHHFNIVHGSQIFTKNSVLETGIS
jgi:hypothetical protein